MDFELWYSTPNRLILCSRHDLALPNKEIWQYKISWFGLRSREHSDLTYFFRISDGVSELIKNNAVLHTATQEPGQQSFRIRGQGCESLFIRDGFSSTFLLKDPKSCEVLGSVSRMSQISSKRELKFQQTVGKEVRFFCFHISIICDESG